MSPMMPVPEPALPAHLAPRVVAVFEEARRLQEEGKVTLAIERLETTLKETSQEPQLANFKDRVSLAMAIAEFSVTAGDVPRALTGLAGEFTFAKAAFQEIKASGTEDDKRTAFRGLVQLRDFHTRLNLIGKSAPELAAKEWLNSSPLSWPDLKGRVVLLEFWATWCKPCEQMFPKLKSMHQDFSAQGLEVVAHTRYFMAYNAPAELQAQEMEMIRGFVNQHSIGFPVAVSEDESVQTAYGATALPIMALIDRQGLVRSFGFSPEDESFSQSLQACLAEPA